MTTNPPIACDMTNAPDTPAQRIAEYDRLWREALVGRERTEDGIRFRLRADAGIEAWVTDLARREQDCCSFFSFRVSVHGEELWWEATVVDDDVARQILDEFYRLPDTAALGERVVRFAG
jgi:hypothetical protein